MIRFRRVLVVIGFLVSGLVGYALLTAVCTEHPVGFQIIKTTDADGEPFTVDVWYPIVQRGSTTSRGSFFINQSDKATMQVLKDKIRIGPF
jgi:hypothetical protein